jgi:hypothetical protein
VKNLRVKGLARPDETRDALSPQIDVDTLAMNAAQTVVQGLAGAAAKGLGERLASFFTRHRKGSEAASTEIQRLEETEHELAGTSPDKLQERSGELEARWRRRFLVFLEDHPDAVTELDDLVRDWAASHPSLSPTSPASMTARGGDNAVVIQSGRDTNLGGSVQR